MKIIVMGEDIIAVGDIHGNLNQLVYPLFEYLNNRDKYKYLIYLGDYTDRGVSSFKVYYIIKSIMESTNWESGLKDKIIFLAGNHDVHNNIDKANKISKSIKKLKGLRLCYYDAAFNILFSHSSQKKNGKDGNTLGLFLNKEASQLYLNYKDMESLEIFKCFTWTSGKNEASKELKIPINGSEYYSDTENDDIISIHGHDHAGENLNKETTYEVSKIKGSKVKDLSIDCDVYRYTFEFNKLVTEYKYITISSSGGVIEVKTDKIKYEDSYDTKSLMDLCNELKKAGNDIIGFNEKFGSEDDIYKAYVQAAFDDVSMPENELKKGLINDIEECKKLLRKDDDNGEKWFDVFSRQKYIEPVEIYNMFGMFKNDKDYNPLRIIKQLWEEEFCNSCEERHPTNSSERSMGGFTNNASLINVSFVNFFVSIFQFILFSIIVICIVCLIVRFIKNNYKRSSIK